MNKWEKEVQTSLLNSEAEVLKELEKLYAKALSDIKQSIKTFDAQIKSLDTVLQQGQQQGTLSPLQASQLISIRQSKVYQKEFQEALQGQVSDVLGNLLTRSYQSISDYLTDSYDNAFIGTMYDLNKQGLPFIFPIDQASVTRAVLLDSKISNGLYNALGLNVDDLKKRITQEISRGIAASRLHAEIARNLTAASGAPLSRTKTIIRTEGHRIQNAAVKDAQERAKAAGADVVKQWDATLDSLTRPDHQLLDGQIREINEPFEVNGKKADRPGEFGTPEEDCNCRCVMLTRARWALDEDELQILQERAAYFELDKSKEFEDFKEKYLAASKEIAKAESDNPVTNKYGNTIIFDEKLNKGKFPESVEIIKQLSNEYDTRLYKVTVGAHNSAGSVDMGGLMRLSASDPRTAFHEFAHSISSSKLQKYGVENYGDFWKEIRTVRNQYRKAVRDTPARWISSYEFGNTSEDKIDEFFAEAFAHAKMAKLGYELPSNYGKDLTFSNKVLEITDKYFLKSGQKRLDLFLENTKINIDTQMYLEKDMLKQSSRALKKGIISLQNQIVEHNAKIANPEDYVTDWDDYTEKHKEGLIKHWEKEKKIFQRSIEDRIEELKKRGDYYE